VPAREKKPINWRAWGLGTLIVLVLVVALQNSQQVDVDVLFINLNAPLIVIILASAAIGALAGYAFPVLRRHRREERRQAKEG
jgi:uncharacterized integral membrane protein